MRKPTVLIIDDEKNLVSSLMFSLEEEMTVFAAYDGKSGLAEIEKQTQTWSCSILNCLTNPVLRFSTRSRHFLPRPSRS